MKVVFHMSPNTNLEQRAWDKFPQLVWYLVNRHDARITVVGGAGDAPQVDAFFKEVGGFYSQNYIQDMVGKTTLDELIALLKSCDLLVCVNSFVMHLGVALGVRMFAIVGATEPKVVLPPTVARVYSLRASDISLQTVIDGVETALGNRQDQDYWYLHKDNPMNR